LIASEARALLASVARVVLVAQRGSLADQLDRVPERCEQGQQRREGRGDLQQCGAAALLESGA